MFEGGGVGGGFKCECLWGIALRAVSKNNSTKARTEMQCGEVCA